MLNLAQRFMRFVLAQAIANQTGFVAGPNGIETGNPNPSAMWPPHRNRPTPPRKRNGRYGPRTIKVRP